MTKSIIVSLALLVVAASVVGAAPLHLSIDKSASEVSATVDEPMKLIRGSAVGTFKVTSGEIGGDSTNVASTGSVKLVIDAASYQSDSASRDKDVKATVLEAGSYPTITFESTALSAITMTSDRAGSATVSGNLTLHGTTRPISVPVTAALDGAGHLIADGEVTFNYEDFGVHKPQLLFGAISAGSDVTVKFHIVATGS